MGINRLKLRDNLALCGALDQVLDLTWPGETNQREGRRLDHNTRQELEKLLQRVSREVMGKPKKASG